ncbi:hypothetical protein quinque_011367 [Culex quinquefasciatus]
MSTSGRLRQIQPIKYEEIQIEGDAVRELHLLGCGARRDRPFEELAHGLPDRLWQRVGHSVNGVATAAA